MKLHWVAVFWVVVFAFPWAALAGSLEQYQPPEAGQVKIVRDHFGVPHIIASEERALYYGTGYAQAEDQLENVLKNYLRAAGRIAEQEGVKQVPIDHLIRMLKIPQRARASFEKIDPQIRGHLEAFAQGVNDYMDEHRDSVPDWAEPVEPYEVMAFSMYIDALFSLSHCRDDLEDAGFKLVATLPPSLTQRGEFGSNQFAVAPSRSASGATMLSMDPHLRHSSFFRWYEMHQVGPHVNTMGACFYGAPYVSLGRTEKTAWCMTVNKPDLGDVFAFEINPENTHQYKGLEGWQDFEEWDETYRMSIPGGKFSHKMTAKTTELGPVVKEQDGVAYVFALPSSDSPQRVRQLYDMNRAQNVDQFKRALEPLGLVMFNIVYADSHGDIFYISNGRVPKRDTRIDSREIRPGDQAWARWQGIHTLDELPQLKNPPSGFLMNTNSGPPSITREEAPQPSDFPPYMMGHKPNSRSRRLFELLDADSSISWDEMHTYATDTKLEAADQWVPPLVEALDQFADQSADEVELLKEVGGVLEAWDRRTDLDSRGAILFVYLLSDDEFVKAAEATDHQRAGAAMRRVAADVIERFGSLDAPWSRYSRIVRGDTELGVAGCGRIKTGSGDEISGAALRPTYGNVKEGRRYCTGGSSYGMLVDFKGPTRSISCLPFGVSEDPDSPHFADHLPLYVKRQFKPTWFLASELAANTESQRTLSVPK